MEFIDWLDKQAEGHGWTRAELARRAKVSSSTIYLIASGDRKPGPDLCDGIARALKLPPETVYRAAGLLPPEPGENSAVEELRHIANQLPDEDIAELIYVARGKLDRHEKRTDTPVRKTKPAG